ncbi:hypothetical protein [Candidatus Poriferisocius sp.]|uniref:hypothetical protein n=1 Tax=Candidatus Poriferisocius sp. TaxID=3101276 RepID=UPI003B01A766
MVVAHPGTVARFDSIKGALYTATTTTEQADNTSKASTSPSSDSVRCPEEPTAPRTVTALCVDDVLTVKWNTPTNQSHNSPSWYRVRVFQKNTINPNDQLPDYIHNDLRETVTTFNIDRDDGIWPGPYYARVIAANLAGASNFSQYAVEANCVNSRPTSMNGISESRVALFATPGPHYDDIACSIRLVHHHPIIGLFYDSIQHQVVTCYYHYHAKNCPKGSVMHESELEGPNVYAGGRDEAVTHSHWSYFVWYECYVPDN